ncbi:hypothetical protein M514_27357 [Trichuris suis]|uniref:Uncharacterized protein n=1 Tax=Trichuris suis TaxID=68888 RepID=A0A085MTD1_9BILA|nr:hypothetical protein M514_27357 [Trichuris suis]
MEGLASIKTGAFKLYKTSVPCLVCDHGYGREQQLMESIKFDQIMLTSPKSRLNVVLYLLPRFSSFLVPTLYQPSTRWKGLSFRDNTQNALDTYDRETERKQDNKK